LGLNFLHMINEYVYRHNIRDYVIRRVLISIIAFFIISFIIFLPIYNCWISSGSYFPLPGIEYKQRIDPVILNYFKWIGAIVKGDFGESLMNPSYYSK
jgi:ABC-type dipeptide/oligopeptide/nickel transport system permease component